jgi:fibronectin-binding autotransporter adhesin
MKRKPNLPQFILRLPRVALALMWLTAALAPAAAATTGTWNIDSGGLWSDAGSWSGGVPALAGDTANLTFDISAASVVTNDVSRSIGVLNIGDSGISFFGYTLTNDSGVTLTFDNSGGGASLVQATTTASDVIATPIILADTLSVTNSSSMTISGVISETGGARSLTKAGSGALSVNGANTYSGGTILNAGIFSAGNDSAFGFGLVTVNSSAQIVAGNGPRIVTNAVTVNGGKLRILSTVSRIFTFSGGLL